jgi:hypothetical protein
MGGRCSALAAFVTTTLALDAGARPQSSWPTPPRWWPAVYVVGTVACFFLPEPKGQELPD